MVTSFYLTSNSLFVVTIDAMHCWVTESVVKQAINERERFGHPEDWEK
jgi:hypothetical protein